ncbi:DUF2461 family protein [Microbacterium sp. Au-Mic1]|uniref:DUF2461 family protein n=1 Tax=Microbacterium sp. Au-Mic1 TaxID=2906457 RepID=UPI001E2AA100|nr:DUF2461 family protein [Microbacterium sp. Au-Mic1]MCE4026013.1 DUF2461 family protein [Microbacterium sp. Au-Mic1]
MSATFPGWSERASAFYIGLEADNSKDYWARNRAVYDAEVLAPMQALLDDLSAEFDEGRIFRPNREYWFSSRMTFRDPKSSWSTREERAKACSF